jgi:hypothetical protein
VTAPEPRRHHPPATGARLFMPVPRFSVCAGGDGHAGAHGNHRGSLDESARRLSHEELLVARTLASEGHTVRSVAESHGGGRTPDLEVCGVPVEVKSWLRLDDRDGVAPGPRSVANKLTAAEGQSATVVLSAAGSGLSPSDATAGLARYAALRLASSIRSVRVMGDGYDLSWERDRAVQLSQRARPRPALGIGM